MEASRGGGIPLIADMYHSYLKMNTHFPGDLQMFYDQNGRSISYLKMEHGENTLTPVDVSLVLHIKCSRL